jgi:hypothetical protein
MRQCLARTRTDRAGDCVQINDNDYSRAIDPPLLSCRANRPRLGPRHLLLFVCKKLEIPRLRSE